MCGKRRHPPPGRAALVSRLVQHFSRAVVLVGVSLYAGAIGHRELENMSCIDATQNASMIRGGMTAVTELKTDPGNLFAASHALCSGMLHPVTAAVISAPLIQRAVHRFHPD